MLVLVQHIKHRVQDGICTIMFLHMPDYGYIFTNRLRFVSAAYEGYFLRVARAGERTRDLLILFIFSFHHFTAEPLRLLNMWRIFVDRYVHKYFIHFQPFVFSERKFMSSKYARVIWHLRKSSFGFNFSVRCVKQSLLQISQRKHNTWKNHHMKKSNCDDVHNAIVASRKEQQKC
jgi:hypothetical protein